MKNLRVLPEMILYTSLLHDSVCGMSDVDFSVYRKIPVADRAVPNVMVALAVPHKMTVIFRKDFTDYFLVLCHYAMTICGSILNDSLTSLWGKLFSSSISGTANLTRLINVSRESFSRTMGISSFWAYHFCASSSNASTTVYSSGWGVTVIFALPTGNSGGKSRYNRRSAGISIFCMIVMR